eukprot:gene127-133_t
MLERVAIIGTGIAGLGLAACLKQIPTGVSEVIVFDPHGDSIDYNQGGAIGLSGGAVILNLLGILHDLQQHSSKVKRILYTYHDEELINVDLTKAKDVFPNYALEPETGDPMIYLLRWSALRLVLKDCVTRRRKSIVQEETKTIATIEEENDHEEEGKVPPEEEGKKPKNSKGGDDQKSVASATEERKVAETQIFFKSGKRLKSIEEDKATQKVSLQFDDGTEERDFDLVIGADGVRSKVREYTQQANKTLFSSIPGFQNTGLRVAQCLTPLRGSVNADPKTAAKLQDLMAKMKHNCSGEIHQWCGDGSNVLTLNVGGIETTHNVFISIYKESSETLHEPNLGWRSANESKSDIKKRLYDAGFDEFHDLHYLLDAVSLTGGQIFEVGIRDSTSPLRSWSSKSGRILLIGDSAHAMSPFLGQGANQALQDAFCLASLIFHYNQGTRLPLVDKINSGKVFAFENYYLNVFFGYLYCVIRRLFDAWAIIKVSQPTKIQSLALEFEKRRKFHTFFIAAGSRILGNIQTLGGVPGFWFKRFFFKLLSALNLVHAILLAPMKPVV